MQEDIDAFRYIVGAECRHADAEVHGKAILQFTRNTARDDFAFRQCTHSAPLFLTVRLSIRFSEGVVWKIRWTYIAGVWMQSASREPTSTRCSTSAIVTRAAVAMTGLKFRAVLR